MIHLVRLLLWMLSKLPAGAPYAIACRIAPLWMKLSPSKRHVAEVNIRRCYPQLAADEQHRMVEQSFVHYVCSVLETGRNWFWPLDRLESLCDEVCGQELIDAALDNDRGVVVLAPHFGAWEYLGMYLQMHQNIAILYKPPAHPGLEKALLERRRRGGANMLPANASGLKRLYAHLRDGQGAGVLPDQEPSAGLGRFIPFFGHDALTAVLAPRLVQKTGCQVLFAVSERTNEGRYRLHVLPAEEDVFSDDVDTALAAVNRGVERCIAINPAQYLWSYKRFRTRPDGQPSFYG